MHARKNARTHARTHLGHGVRDERFHFLPSDREQHLGAEYGHGLYRYGLNRYGLYSYGLYSYGLYNYGRRQIAKNTWERVPISAITI